MTVRKAIGMVGGITSAVMLLLLGWGMRDAAGFFASPARAIFLVILITEMVASTVMLVSPFRKGSRGPGGQRLLFAALQVVTIGLLLLLPYGDRRGIGVIAAAWVRWLGLVSFIGAGVILILALHTLGENYSAFVTIQEKHQLVQSGIYGVVRHPIYLGNLLSWPGACLVFRSWLVIPAFAFFLAFAVLRGAQEERLLADHFGDEFEVYRRRTWRLVPHVY